MVLGSTEGTYRKIGTLEPVQSEKFVDREDGILPRSIIIYGVSKQVFLFSLLCVFNETSYGPCIIFESSQYYHYL